MGSTASIIHMRVRLVVKVTEMEVKVMNEQVRMDRGDIIKP